MNFLIPVLSPSSYDGVSSFSEKKKLLYFNTSVGLSLILMI